MNERCQGYFFPQGVPTTVSEVPTERLELDAWEAGLRHLRPCVILAFWSTPPLPESWLSEADCPLHYVCHVAGSIRRVVPRSFIERGGWVTNWGAQCASAVAEHALLLALAALRSLPRWAAYIESQPDERRWQDLNTLSLHNRQVGIHGFGRVARILAELLKPFGVSIRAFSAGVPDAYIAAHGVTPCHSLHELCAGSDVLFECEALTETTRGSMDAKDLALLPDGAVFVNIARGALVDEAALRREASNGRLRVALDVCHQDPLEAGNPLYQTPGALLSPHIAGPTVDQFEPMGRFALANIERFLRGETPAGLIDLAEYDRMT
ncbi:hydroxyacid dehydrogenase [Ruficoccus sp. ZRK36]|uniref:hydroxyacid dehydrogenase n=1 Tax=Ruficoccus sp. ZRK36 TaxID=2866311 RepID=UPI001C73A3D1|nr:hydroxyacid dehydrogenase [Ruficoccus sp. ZRK36]QYY37275.1 hydroxyacid dehydrogenase [Ruficoccus sp. ZRK36]